MSNRYYTRPNWRYRTEIVDKQNGTVVSEWKTSRKASKECQILNGTYKGDTPATARYGRAPLPALPALPAGHDANHGGGQ